MVANLNKVILIGFCGKEPQLRLVGTKEVASFSLATSYSYKTTSEFKTKTEWHNIVVWNEYVIEKVKKSVKKGSLLYIEGAITYRKWSTDEGHDRITTEIIIQPLSGNMIVLSKDERPNLEPPSEDEIPF